MAKRAPPMSVSLGVWSFAAVSAVLGQARAVDAQAPIKSGAPYFVRSYGGFPAVSEKSDEAMPISGRFARETEARTLVPPNQPPPNHITTRSPSRSRGNVVYESIFGPASKSQWQPMTLSTFFTEGWDKPFVNAPEGTNGAPKQFWVNAPAGVFGRYMFADFFYTNGLRDVPGLLLNGEPWSPVHPKHTTGNQYTGAYSIFVPLNARMEIQIIAPFINSNQVGTSGAYQGNFGDLAFQARFHLIEHRNFSVVGFIGERTPTGNFVNGNNINFVSPSLEAWWNFAPKWVVRAGTGINIRTNHVNEIADIYFNKLSFGRYVTGKDAAIFKDLAIYGTATVLTDVTGQASHVTDLYVGPGIRFGMGKEQKLAISCAVQAPVTGPQTYAWQPSFSAIMKY